VSNRQWAAVDDYFTAALVETDDALHAALTASDAAGLPAIAVSPVQGKLLKLLAILVNARRILEIGTLAGYSTIWLARALPPDGRLITLESEPRHAEVARANIAKAGLADLVDVRVGTALETLPQLARELDSGRVEPFDLVFIDADKPGYSAYWDELVPRVRPGGVLLADNVLWSGEIADESVTTDNAIALRAFNERVAADDRVEVAVVPAYDGLTIARKR
jgi:predicted O-methyltransferase YrrM